MKSIAVLTSGGDAPGMNAAIRSVVRTGLSMGYKMVGVKNGYAGLIAGDFIPMGARDVGGILQLGGTILGSARCHEFETVPGRETAIKKLQENSIDALVVIGGNGSQTGAHELDRMGFPVVGVASTIDNDLCGSEITIGVDTALNIALEAIDRLKVTASSHQRAFLVEVMGRKCGYLALMAGIAGGAEAIVLPEDNIDPDDLAEIIRKAYEKGKRHALIVVAEGAQMNAQALVNHFIEHKDRLGYDLRATSLGHVQRGGSPGAYDRLLATRFGAAAVQALTEGKHGCLVGINKSAITTTPYEEITGKKKSLDLSLLELSRSMDQ